MASQSHEDPRSGPSGEAHEAPQREPVSELLSPVWSHLTTLHPVRGEGVYLFDAHGRRYLDFTSGIGVTNTGHCHPAVVEAIRAQAGELLFGQINTVVTPAVERLAAALREVLPRRLDSYFFSNSGAEAVEAGVKLARHATGRPNVVAFQGSFHGRTAQTMALTTAKTVYRHRYAPLPAGVVVAPFPEAHEAGVSEDEASEHALRELRRILHAQTAPDETAAFLLEPVLGEGGYRPAPAAFLRGLRELADEHGILLALDEVQSGFGRTGRWFAFEHAGIVPDILIMAKGLGSGLPISAVAAPAALMRRWETGTHGGTYGGGSTVPLAAAEATIRVMQAEDLPGNAAAMGERLVEGLRRLQQRYEVIDDVRGLGLMVGVAFAGAEDGGGAALAREVQRGCIDERLLLLTCGTWANVIRWIPPLVVGPSEIDDALATFERALARATARTRESAPAVAGGARS